MDKLFQQGRVLILLCIITFVPGSAYSQLEISAQAGYLSTSNIPVTKGDIDIKGNADYGLGINYYLIRGVSIAFDWDIQKTSADLVPFNGDRKFITDVTNQHFLAGVVVEPGRGKTRAFGSFTTGVTIFHPDDDRYEDAIKFTVALGLGGKFFITDRVGLKLQARLILPLQLGGGTFWCGTGGCGWGVGSYTTFVQGDFSGGIIVRI